MKKLLFLLPLLITSCLFNKDDDMSPPEPIDPIDQLPPITMEGANTFGCLMNGEAWIPETSSFSEDDIDAIYDAPNEGFQIHLNKITEEINQTLSFFVLNLTSEENRPIEYDEQILIDFTLNRKYELDTLLNHTLSISRFDKPNKIISGVFEFTLINRDFNDTLKITDGRFDVEYRD